MRRVAQTGISAVVLAVVLASTAAAAGPRRHTTSKSTISKSIAVNGLDRKYLVFVPSRAKEPLPVLLVFHGGGGNAEQMQRYSRFDDVAEKEGFLAIYPDAIEGHWNDGRGVEYLRAQKQNIDDVKFVRTLLDEVAAEHKIDHGRVFATGISNGGFLSHRLAAEASDLIAGIAPVAGGMAPAIAEKFKPEQPVSILLIQGDADPVVPFAGGDVGFPGTRKRGKVLPTAETLAKYVERNGNRGDPTVTTLDTDPNDGTSVEIAKYPDGPGGVQTLYFRVKNGGHTWPGRPLYLPERTIGKACQDFSATETICEFFKSCPARKSKYR